MGRQFKAFLDPSRHHIPTGFVLLSLGLVVDDGRGVVLLLFSGKSDTLVKGDFLLNGGSAFLGLGDRRDELGRPTRVEETLRRLVGLVELPVPRSTI